MNINNEVMKRFFKNIIKNEKTACWIWTASKFRDGYGRISVDGKSKKAHRLSYTYFKGEIPDGLYVCHHCDNPPCCNPDHLFIGTAKDNRADQQRKLRHNHGERVNTNKLSENQVREIIYRWDNSDAKFGMCSSLGREYGVSDTAIRNIVFRIGWKHLNL